MPMSHAPRRRTVRAMEINNPTEALMHATVTTRTTFGRGQTRKRGLWLSARRTLKQLQATIVNGSDHPCWNPAETTASRKEQS